MINHSSKQAPQGSQVLRTPENQILVPPKVGDASLLITRIRELDREFNRQSKHLAKLAKKFKTKIADRL